MMTSRICLKALKRLWWKGCQPIRRSKTTSGHESGHDFESRHFDFGRLLSAVDAKTEHAIYDNLKHTRKDKTTIITAHRLSAVVHADLILVMQDGRIIERGRHEDLLAQGGWYAKTYESQQLEMEGGEEDDA